MSEKISKSKHVAMRTCIATKVKRPKNELVRFVLNPQTKRVEIDIRSKIRARGGNLDATEEAFDIMQKRRSLIHALKLSKDLSLDDYARLKIEFLKAIEEKNFRPTNKAVKIRVSKEELSKLKENIE